MNPIRTFKTKPFIIVTDVGVVGAFRLRSEARGEAYRMAQYDRPRVIDLCDVDGFSEAAANAGDLTEAYVAGLAGGRTVAEIAEHYRARIYDDHGRQVTARDARHVVAGSIRECIGGLSRQAARRQGAEWILAS